VSDWPYALTFGVFFLLALARGSATYWAGRALRYGGQRTPLARHLDRPAVARAEAVVGRFGAPAVAVSFLTIGFQTAVNAAAGALRMPWWRYVPGLVVGALFWATIYTTIGFAVLEAWFGEHPWPWVIGAVVAVLVVVAATWLVRRRRASRLGVESRSEDSQPA
jgi:membrane protein DedA with SNARE-associated domain